MAAGRRGSPHGAWRTDERIWPQYGVWDGGIWRDLMASRGVPMGYYLLFAHLSPWIPRLPMHVFPSL
jgi:hypothetical protein